MSTEDLLIHSMLGNYSVHFYENFSFLSELAARPNPVLVVDSEVLRLYHTAIHASFGERPMYVIEAVEEKKNLNETARMCQWILDHFKAKRNIDFISIGGGITQDISGFVASTLFRGVGWDFVPTTLLAQVDSCIGGKTSLNFGNRKNLLGTFYPPRAVHIAPEFTTTLSQLDLYSGYGEIAKFLLMKSFETAEPLQDAANELAQIVRQEEPLTPLIRKCLNVKRSFMELDEFDQGRRNLLNYGHCFGHALEASSGYYVPHGIAVNIGILFANLAAAERGLISTPNVELIKQEINLPLLIQTQRPEDYVDEVLLDNLKNDKKRTGNALPLVVPVANGLEKLNDFSETEFQRALEKLRKAIFR